MVINLSELLSTTLKTEKFSIPIESEFFEAEGRKFAFVKKEPVELVISNAGEQELSLQGEIHVVINIPCDRCLTDVEIPFDLIIEKTLDFKASSLERINEMDETSYIEGSNLDVDLLVFNEVLLNFPMKTICREDCKGICYRCGKDLNIGDCGCDLESGDLRMSAIRDIFNNFKEV